MNKNELVASIAKKSGLSVKDSEKSLNVLIHSITAALKAKEKVTLVGFGVFETVKRAARMGRNPKTGKTIKIEATVSPKFRPGKTLKDIIAGRAQPKKIAPKINKTVAGAKKR